MYTGGRGSIGGCAGLGQPGRGARATQLPSRRVGHVHGGRVGGGWKKSLSLPITIILYYRLHTIMQICHQNLRQ
jgi:hypothetical protein